MPQLLRSRRSYDHRIREIVCQTGNPRIFQRLRTAKAAARELDQTMVASTSRDFEGRGSNLEIARGGHGKGPKELERVEVRLDLGSLR